MEFFIITFCHLYVPKYIQMKKYPSKYFYLGQYLYRLLIL